MLLDLFSSYLSFNKYEFSVILMIINMLNLWIIFVIVMYKCVGIEYECVYVESFNFGSCFVQFSNFKWELFILCLTWLRHTCQQQYHHE